MTAVTYEDERAFANVLVSLEMLQDREAVLYYFDRPDNWYPELKLWMEYGRPVQESDHGWTEFIEAYELLIGAL